MKLRMVFLSLIFSIVMVATISNVSVAQGCNVDGIGTPPYNLDVADLTYLVDYLWQYGPEPPDYDAADMDEYQIITINDLRVLGVYMFASGPEPICPPAFGPLPRMRDPDNWLELEEDEFPAAKQPLTLHFRLTTSRTIDCINLPLSIMVGHYAPQIVEVRLQEPFTSWNGINPGYISRGDGKVMFSLANLSGTGLAPQDDVLLAEVDISLTQPHPDALPITIEWDLTVPPVGPYGRSHYPFLLQHHTARQANDTAWIPDLRGGRAAVPTITGWGLIALLVLLLGGGVWVIIHRRKEVVART